MKKWKNIVWLIVVVGFGVWVLLSFGSRGEGSQGAVSGNTVPKRIVKRVSFGKKVRAHKAHKSVHVEADETGEHRRKKPEFDIDDDDEAALNAEQRKMIESIRDALAREDKKTLIKLVQKLQSSDEWPDGIPKSIKMAAIEALGWFGHACLPEIAGFLADGDEEVMQSAIDKYEEVLEDPDLSDRERSLILIQASKVIHDADAMDSMLFELNNMRHSVAVETLKVLMSTGNDATKKVLLENIESYTGEDNIDTPEKLDSWLKENPDDEDDEEFYGGSDD